LKPAAAAILVAGYVMRAAFITSVGGCIPDLPPDQVTGAVCGDGVIDLDAGEQCDPGPGAAADDSGVAVAGCKACRIECPGFVWDNHHCYHVEQNAWTLQSGNVSASGLCQGATSHVVTFASNDERNAVTTYLASVSESSPFWVGLNPDPGNPSSNSPSYSTVLGLFEPGWAAQCPGCYAGWDAGSALPLFPGVPDGGAGCVIASPDPSQPWEQYPCSVSVPLRRSLVDPQTVCEREPVGKRSSPCQAGICIDLPRTHGAKSYVYLESPVSADDANSACLAISGRLVVLQSPEEREQLWRELSQLTVPPYAIWIGLSLVGNCRAPRPRWSWDDGTPDDQYPSEWGERQPARCLSSRAFLLHQSGADDTLAHSDQQSPSFPAVCEITAGTLQPDATPD
jgi:Lectin C-type domain